MNFQPVSSFDSLHIASVARQRETSNRTRDEEGYRELLALVLKPTHLPLEERRQITSLPSIHSQTMAALLIGEDNQSPKMPPPPAFDDAAILQKITAALSKPQIYMVPPPNPFPSQFNLHLEREIIHLAAIENLFQGLLIIKTIRCFSSIAMSHLLEWRNPPQPLPGEPDSATATPIKKICTQLALPVLTVSAAVEFVAYKVIELGAMALSPITKRPIEFVREHGIDLMATSALFTASWWSLTSMAKNLTEHRLATDELAARTIGIEKSTPK